MTNTKKWTCQNSVYRVLQNSCSPKYSTLADFALTFTTQIILFIVSPHKTCNLKKKATEENKPLTFFLRLFSPPELSRKMRYRYVFDILTSTVTLPCASSCFPSRGVAHSVSCFVGSLGNKVARHRARGLHPSRIMCLIVCPFEQSSQ